MASGPRTPSDDAAITWIHLSDFHAGQRGEAVWHQIEVELEKNVLEMASRLGVPDIVLFTGDLANRGGRSASEEDEYAKVDRILDRINRWMKRDVPVFAVPGNHDLVRPKKTWEYSAFAHYEEEESFREALWNDGTEVRGLLDHLFPHYTEWMKRRVIGSLTKAGWNPYVSSRMPGDLSVVVEKNDLRLGLIGLNSAWVHLSDDVKERLQLPIEQFHAALPQTPSGNPLDWLRSGYPSFLLMHHPPDWLTEKAQATFQSEIFKPEYFALLLYGHMHKGQFQAVDYSGMGPRRSHQSPSLFGLEHYGKNNELRAFGYQWGRLTARGEIRVWPQKVVQRNDGSLVFDRDQGFGRASDDLGGTVLRNESPADVLGTVTSSVATVSRQDPIPLEVFDLTEAHASARQLLSASRYQEHDISREALTALIADARSRAQESVINISGDLSWLREEIPALRAVTQSRPDLSLCVYYDRTRVPGALKPVLREVMAFGVQLRPYPIGVSSHLRCMLIDHQSDSGQRVVVFTRSGQPSVREPRSQHRFVWREFIPGQDAAVIEATQAFVRTLEAVIDKPIRVGIMGVNNVGKTSLAKALASGLRLQYEVELIPDVFRGLGTGTSLEENMLMLYWQLERETRVSSSNDVVIIDRTLADNLCFSAMRGYDIIYSRLAPQIAEQTKRLDLLIDVRRTNDEYCEDTRRVSSGDRIRVRSLLDKFIRDYQVDTFVVRIDPGQFEASLSAAVTAAVEEVTNIHLARLCSQ